MRSKSICSLLDEHYLVTIRTIISSRASPNSSVPFPSTQSFQKNLLSSTRSAFLHLKASSSAFLLSNVNAHRHCWMKQICSRVWFGDGICRDDCIFQVNAGRKWASELKRWESSKFRKPPGFIALDLLVLSTVWYYTLLTMLGCPSFFVVCIVLFQSIFSWGRSKQRFSVNCKRQEQWLAFWYLRYLLLHLPMEIVFL